jgi:hypothetical protein
MGKYNIDENELVEKAVKSVDTFLEFRSPRIKQIQKYEDMYFGKTKPALKGRFNIPVPILEGYVQTLMSKIDDNIKVEFNASKLSRIKTAKEINSIWIEDSAPDKGDYNGADLDAKMFAIFSGFGALKLTAQSKPYEQKLEAIDYYDFIFEPNGGRKLQNHTFKGELNIFKSKLDLEKGVKSGLYRKAGVNKIIREHTLDDQKRNETQAKEKSNRFTALNMDPSKFAYSPSALFNLTQLVIRAEDGQDYLLLFDYKSHTIIRLVNIKEISNLGLSPYIVWQTDRNPANILGKSPLDGVYPVAESMRILINENFDNIHRRNWDMVLYNAKKIMDPTQFQYRPNGLISVNLNQGEAMSSAYEKMQTPDTSNITINLLSFLDNFVGQKTGVTPGAQGAGQEDKVAIYYGNIKEVSDRFGLLNKFYKEAHVQIAKRFKDNLITYLPDRGYMVKIIGPSGAKTEEVIKSELKDDFSINIVSQKNEAMDNELTRKKQESSLAVITKDPELKQSVNKDWLLKQWLRLGEYSEEDIRNAMSKDDIGNVELMGEAENSIEQIIAGDKPKINRGATTSFIKKIVFEAQEKLDELPNEIIDKIIAYAKEHIPIVIKNSEVMNSIDTMIQPQQPQQQPQQPPELPQQTQQPVNPIQ